MTRKKTIIKKTHFQKHVDRVKDSDHMHRDSVSLTSGVGSENAQGEYGAVCLR